MIARSPWISALGVVGLAAFLGACDFGSAATGETRTETVSFDLDNSNNPVAALRSPALQFGRTSLQRKFQDTVFIPEVL